MRGLIVKGVVLDGNSLHDSIKLREPLAGAIITNTSTGKGTSSDLYGNFKICLSKGDCLEISFLDSLLDEMCLGGAIRPQKEHLNIKATVNDSPKKIKVKNPKRNKKGNHQIEALQEKMMLSTKHNPLTTSTIL